MYYLFNIYISEANIILDNIKQNSKEYTKHIRSNETKFDIKFAAFFISWIAARNFYDFLMGFVNRR